LVQWSDFNRLRQDRKRKGTEREREKEMEKEKEHGKLIAGKSKKLSCPAEEQRASPQLKGKTKSAWSAKGKRP